MLICFNMNQQDNDPRTLADVFLIVLEQKSTNQHEQSHVQKLKTLIKVPECAELLSCTITNALGYPITIEEKTIDKAVDCIIEFHKHNIDAKEDDINKKLEKNAMIIFVNDCKVALKANLESKGLLILKQ